MPVSNRGKNNVLLGVIYRHPKKDDGHFLTYLENIFKKLQKERKTVIIAGDFNFNLLNYDKDQQTEIFLDMMFLISA